jgi:large subunit ribosomal protein L29
MAVLRPKDIRKMKKEELDKRLEEFKLELAKEKASIDIGSTISSPGRIREIKRAIARIKTIQKGGK